jgi:hypothetical protein
MGSPPTKKPRCTYDYDEKDEWWICVCRRVKEALDEGAVNEDAECEGLESDFYPVWFDKTVINELEDYMECERDRLEELCKLQAELVLFLRRESHRKKALIFYNAITLGIKHTTWVLILLEKERDNFFD